MFSAITSLIGLSGLLLFDFMMLRSLGIGGVTVMLLSLLVSMTLLPAMVSVIGTKINAIRIMPAMNIVSNFWHGLARWVMRHPLPVVLQLTIFLLLISEDGFISCRLIFSDPFFGSIAMPISKKNTSALLV